MVVRQARFEDRAPLIELIKGYFAFYHVPFVGETKLGALLDALDQHPDRGAQLVAEADGRLQGFATLYSCYDTLLADRILVMNDLFVDPAARDRGVGAALYDASLAYAAGHGYLRLDWVTAEDNHGARRFYERHGGRRGPWVSYSATVGAG
ncbi:MAG: GNAT family N-acetyltransferase [Chloroflexi bacterium]|nr:MAG: GNAT family N-acetyltransferase [Chloroflexota bacterium]